MLTLTYTSRDESALPSGSTTFNTYTELKNWIQYGNQYGKYLDVVELSGSADDESLYDLFSGYHGTSHTSGCCRASKLIFTNWDCSNITDMSNMCCYNSYLTEIVDFNTRDFSSVETIYAFCGYCANLTTFNFSNVYAPNLTNMGFITASCTSLTSRNFTHITAPKLGNISGVAFDYATNTTSYEVDFSYLKTNSTGLKITEGSSRYPWLKNVTKYTLDYAEIPNVTNLDFSDSSKITDISLQHMVVNPNLSITISRSNISENGLNFKNTDLTINGIKFSECNNLVILDFSSICTSYTPKTLLQIDKCANLTTICDTNNVIDATRLSTEFSTPFYANNCNKLESIELPNISITYTGAYHTFYSLPKLETVDLHSIILQSSGYYGYFADQLFYNLPELTSVPDIIFVYNDSKGAYYNYVSQLVYGCPKVTEINLGFDDVPTGSSITCGAFQNVFAECTSLKSINVINNDNAIYFTVYNMRGAFSGCSSLEDIPSFIKLAEGKSNSIDITDAFLGCESFISVDLSILLGKFDYNITGYSNLFKNCTGLTTIMCKRTFPILQDSTKMADVFLGCTSLQGAISYDSSKVDGNYANPTTGYFTKPETSLTFYINGQECNELYVNGVQCDQLFINGVEIG